MRDVYVAGIGITTFTRLEYPRAEISSYASMMALKDAGIKTDILLYARRLNLVED